MLLMRCWCSLLGLLLVAPSSQLVPSKG
jgi:hypothetical protein